jgi:hypothetical protein
VVHTVSWFADHRLGKGVVVAKDTPNFIANHIGLFGVIQVLRALESGDYTIEEIDAITGPILGRPRSATFHDGSSQESTSSVMSHGTSSAAGPRRHAAGCRAATR